MWLGRFTIVLMLLSISGIDRMIVQTYAWTNMIRDRAPTIGWQNAVNDTLSGDHPCEICLAIAKAAQESASEESPEPSSQKDPLLKRYFANTTSTIPPAFLEPSKQHTFQLEVNKLRSIKLELPTPPPRQSDLLA